MHKIQCILFLLFISGCATVAKGPSFSEAMATKAKPGHATIYVFREHAEPTAWGANVQINGKPVSTLNQGGFTWVYSKPGATEVKALWPGMSGQKDSVISFNTKPEIIYFVELTGVSQAKPGFPMIYFKMGSGLNQMEPGVAIKKLDACCKFQKPVSDTL